MAKKPTRKAAPKPAPKKRAAPKKTAKPKGPVPTSQARSIAKQDAFIAAFKVTASITKAAKSAQVERDMHYRWLDDPAYKAKFEEARKQASQTLEDEAVRRAREGTPEPVYYQGIQCGVIWRYSDGLLMRLLEAHMPEKYRRNFKVEHSGPHDGPVLIAAAKLADVFDLDVLEEAARRLKEKADTPAEQSS